MSNSARLSVCIKKLILGLCYIWRGVNNSRQEVELRVGDFARISWSSHNYSVLWIVREPYRCDDRPSRRFNEFLWGRQPIASGPQVFIFLTITCAVAQVNTKRNLEAVTAVVSAKFVIEVQLRCEWLNMTADMHGRWLILKLSLWLLPHWHSFVVANSCTRYRCVVLKLESNCGCTV